ncbi:unnamed protein product [Adineta ricciae]|uniref:Gag-like protein n=1 Tax=Adineta ricciae TaxID=249248 RepID=A0A814GCU8_ADIRI|nr:unnamed protein product [Adineta ricciae]
MSATNGRHEGAHTEGGPSSTDPEYWQTQMNNDQQFIQHMIEIYKAQQLEPRQIGKYDSQMNHQSQQTIRQLPRLMDQPAYESPIQQHQRNQRITTSSMNDTNSTATLINQVSSTPRRTLDESTSPGKAQRQVKKHRADEMITATMNGQATAASPSARNFGFPISHLKYAVANKPPCFFIKFNINQENNQSQIPSVINTVKWIRDTVQQQNLGKIEEFSLFVSAGNNRYKFGVASKDEFLTLWKCKWPNKIMDIDVEVERPRALPDFCAVVIRNIPMELNNQYLYQEITKTIESASSLTKINYSRPRTTNDYRCCITDTDEYNEILKIGRIAIGHLLLSITPFMPGLKMTYCNKCWELGHTKNLCKKEAKCRLCLEPWNYNHQCQKPVCCAQCKGGHFSLSMDCSVVRNYRQTLKEEVNIALKEGTITEKKLNSNPHNLQRINMDFPTLQPQSGKQQAWTQQQADISNGKTIEGEKWKEIQSQMQGISDALLRMETKYDNQLRKLEIMENSLAVNKQGILVLANIIQQTINALTTGTEKKNKQALQAISQQVEAFKNDLIEKFVTVTINQQTTETLSLRSDNKQTLPPTNSTTTTTSTATTTNSTATTMSTKLNQKKQVEIDHSMNSNDE